MCSGLLKGLQKEECQIPQPGVNLKTQVCTAVVLGVLLLEVAVAQAVAVGVFQLEVAVVEGQVPVETGEVMIKVTMVTKERNIPGGIFLIETTFQLRKVKRKRKEKTAVARRRWK